ncbi:hypothetical protein QE152_g1293 [Popillia japonica]|uniref:Reverse transcriptase domain-containing protein n=1 Tax=Popillia japonica TaxID=7064 RepID=A0AAW1N7Y2_POPJA
MGTPIVAIPKASNKIRLYGDYKVTVNPNLVIDSHPIPTVEELFTVMSRGEKFTKIDLSQAYLQLELTPEHPIPTVEELFTVMSRGEKFTKIDLSQAYLQLELTPESREILTLNTHKGLYQPTRLMYGIASAPAIWQRQIEIILGNIPGVTVILDDIKITGADTETHMKRLEQVLHTLDKHNMRKKIPKGH